MIATIRPTFNICKIRESEFMLGLWGLCSHRRVGNDLDKVRGELLEARDLLKEEESVTPSK